MGASRMSEGREPAVIGVQEAASYLKINHNEVLRMLKARELDGFKRGTHWRISYAACDRWIAEQEEAYAGAWLRALP